MEAEEVKQKQETEQRQAEERSSPSGRIVYKAILQEGREELERPTSALFWSGLAAGLSMGFSMITEALLRQHLPESNWQPLVSKFGYSMGFLLVILGRQQLFTENTLTPILPLLLEKSVRTLANVFRLWAVVLTANLLGGLAVACVAMRTSVFDEPMRHQFAEMGREAMQFGFGTVLVRGVFAGWLIALMIWLLPFAEAARVWVIILLTYIVGLAHFSHIIAGSIDIFSLGFAGDRAWGDIVLNYLVPALIGNTIGGVTLVAALNHAQIVSGAEGEDV